MKRTSLAVFLAMLTASACTSIPQVKGPFARADKGAVTQTDAVADDAPQPEGSPFPQQSPFGN
ncbi:MAG TPA: hypothetical protein VF936_11915 [Burkholderiales bacterium]